MATSTDPAQPAIGAHLRMKKAAVRSLYQRYRPRLRRQLWVATAWLGLLACGGDQAPNSGAAEVVEQSAKLRIGYSEKVETLALLYNLSSTGDYHYNEIPGPRGILSQALTKEFAAYRAHPAVTKLNQLLADGFVDMYDIMLACYHTELPEFRQFAPYPSVYYENEGLTAAETQARFDDFNAAVVQFYEEAGLREKFRSDYRALYDKLLAEVQVVAPEEQFVAVAEAYFGIQRADYEILVSAFSFNGIGRAILIDRPGGSSAVALVTSNPARESDSLHWEALDAFTIGYNDPAYFQEIGLHELIHTFFHEALKENKENQARIDRLDHLFTAALREEMRRQGYVDWRSCFEEHLVRLAEVKIATLLGDQVFAEAYRQHCIQERGFVYFEKIEGLMATYEAARESYPSIGDFMPVLLTALEASHPPSAE